MNLIKKTAKRKENQNFNTEVYASNFNDLLDEIRCLQDNIKCLKYYRTKDGQISRQYYIENILEDLENIERLYYYFIKEIKEYQMRLAEIRKWHKPEEYVYEYNANVIEFLLQKKKIIRSEFEKSYIYFRNTVKSLNNKEIPMNKILTQIRDVFDFDSKKINSSDISELNEKYQYKYI